MSLYPWQHASWESLTHRHSSAGLPHALLFAGAEGTGKHSLCLAVATWLLCKTNADGKAAKACGQCHSCQLMAAGTHPDFMICQPEEDSRQIRIDTVRRLNQFIYSTPQISHCQVVILRPLEVMNVSAANALLKTLEEPPGESFLLLEAERPGSVLPTIRSRCQTISLSLPPETLSLQWMAEQGVAEDDALAALKRNGHAPLAAHAWLTSELSNQQAHWLEQIQQFVSGSLSLDALSGPLSKSFPEVIDWWYDLTCDLMRAYSGAPNDLCRHGDLAARLLNDPVYGRIAVDIQKLLTFLDKLQQLNAQLKSGAAHHNKTLTIEVLLLEWRQMLANHSGVISQ